MNFTQKQNAELRKAVSLFNSKVKRLEAKNLDYEIPEKLKVSELKQDIKSKQELKRVINSLRRFTKRGSEEEVEYLGKNTTKWSKRENIIDRQVATRALNRELKKIQIIKNSGVHMGSTQENKIKQQIQDIKNIKNAKGYYFKKILNDIKQYGKWDFQSRRGEQWKQNYLKMLKDSYVNFPDYENLVSRIKSFDAKSFYILMSNNDQLVYIPVMYRWRHKKI